MQRRQCIVLQVHPWCTQSHSLMSQGLWKISIFFSVNARECACMLSSYCIFMQPTDIASTESTQSEQKLQEKKIFKFLNVCRACSHNFAWVAENQEKKKFAIERIYPNLNIFAYSRLYIIVFGKYVPEYRLSWAPSCTLPQVSWSRANHFVYIYKFSLILLILSLFERDWITRW